MSTASAASARDISAHPGVGYPKLSPEDLKQFHEKGFVVPKFRFSEDETARLKGLLYRLIELNPRWASHTNSPHIPGSGTMGVKSFDGWMEFCEHPAILDMMEQLMGPDIILWGSSTFYKKASKGGATPFHRDTANGMIKPLTSSILVWIAATEARVDNGCMRFIPSSNLDTTVGNHTNWLIDDPKTGTEQGVEIDKGEYDASKSVDCELEAGQMVIFNAHTIHGSHSNQGLRDRASYTVRYMPATCKYDHDAAPKRKTGYHGFGTRPLLLVRGVDRAGNDFRRGHPGLDPNLEAPKDH